MRALNRAVRACGDQFRGDFGGEDSFQHRRGRFACPPRARRPGNQVLDQCLGQARIDVVMRHVIANAISAPAQRRFREVACADHQRAFMVGRAEEIVGAQARLHVLECHIVLGASFSVRVAEIGQHALGRRADINLAPGDTHGICQRDGLFMRRLAGGKSGQGIGKNIRARQAQPVEGTRGNDEGLRGIQPARNADDSALYAAGAQALNQCLALDGPGLEAILVQTFLVCRHEGEAPDGALQRQCLIQRRSKREANLPPACQALARIAGRVPEGGKAQAVLNDPLHIDLGHEACIIPKARAACDSLAQLAGNCLPVPGEVRRALATAGGGEDIGAKRAL